jgi:glycosyltransferase involved in cell wall biosynthesis
MGNPHKTLIILSPGFPENEGDSTCLPSQQHFITALNNRFPLLKIIILSFIYPFHNHQYEWHGNTVIAFNGNKKRRLLRMLLWADVWKVLRKINKEENVAGILSFWLGECAFVGKRFANKNKLMHYCWMLGQDARENNPYVTRIRPKADELIAISDALQQEYFKNYSILPEHVIPIGVNGHFISSSHSRDIDILAAGSLIPLKQYDVFVDVIAALKKYFPKIHVALCGKGPEEFNLIKKIVELNLQGTVYMKGERPHEELLGIMLRTKIFLHTSSYEGLSAVCIEALQAGAHVISFCKPMNTSTNHWHIVQTKEEMIGKAVALLNDADLNHQSITPYKMTDAAKSILDLFHYNESAT